MKKLYALLTLVAACLTSCNENEVPFYAADSDGIYFNYTEENEFTASVNFANYMVGDSTFLSVPIKLKTLGYLSEQDRRVVLKEEAVDSYEKAEVEIPDIIMPAGETEINVIIKVLRPAENNKQYAVKLSVDNESPENQIDNGVEEKAYFTIYSQETYERPDAWINVEPYYGTWTKEKFIFLAKVTKNDQYYTDAELSNAEIYNIAAVDSIRTYYYEHPDAEKNIDIPLIQVSGWDGTYDQPYYWGEMQEHYMGTYNHTVFGYYCSNYGITTANESEEFASTEENMKAVNKKAVTALTNYMNQQFQQGSSLSYAASSFSIPLYADMMDEYEFAEPYWWVNYPTNTPEGGVPTAIFMDDYYGTYSDSKYRFMIKTLLEARGADNFSLAEMFPVGNDFMGGLSWDYMISQDEAMKQIQDCHDLFIEKYDKNPNAYDFTFPREIVFPQNGDSGKDK